MRILIVMSLLVFLTSCHVSSKTAMTGSSGRTSYNQVLQMTNSEQMLLNLIRLRYYDAPFFLDVGTITTQFSYKGTVNSSLPIPGFSKENPFVIGGDFTWTDQPTIQYTPLEGQAFAKQLLTPVDLRMVQQLVLSGWDIELVFRLVIQGFNDYLNAPEAAGPIPEFIPRYQSFFEVSKLFRYFQKRSELKIGVKHHACKKKEGEEDVYEEQKQVLQIAIPVGTPEAEKLASYFPDCTIMNEHYVIHLDLGFTPKGKIGIMPRSILSCMYYLSLGIQVPNCDVSSGRVCSTKGIGGEIFDWKEVMCELITIQNSRSYPENAYVATKYKDFWFYIDDCDARSKKTFLLLLQLYNLKSQEPKNIPPLLSLPLSQG